MFHKTTVNVR